MAADQALEAAEASAAKKIKFNLDDLDLSAGSIFSDSRTLNIGGDSKLDSLRNTCILRSISPSVSSWGSRQKD